MFRYSIYSVRTAKGRERDAAFLLQQKALYHKLDVKSILSVDVLKGYIFVEGQKYDIDQGVSMISQFRGKRLEQELTIEELESHLVPKPTIEGLHINDVVEIIQGPFKGSRAKVKLISTNKEEITVELAESKSLTIPIIIHADMVRRIELASERSESDLDFD